MTRLQRPLLGLLLLLFSCACQAQLIKPSRPFPSERLTIAVIPSLDGQHQDSLSAQYPHVLEPDSGFCNSLQNQILGAHDTRLRILEGESRDNELKLPKEATALSLSAASPGALEALVKDLQGFPKTLPGPLRARLRRSSKDPWMLVGRLAVYSQDWQEFARHLRSGRAIRQYTLRFGLAIEWRLYNLQTGEAGEGGALREAFIMRRDRRWPPKPGGLAKTGDRLVLSRFTLLGRKLASRLLEGRHYVIDS